MTKTFDCERQDALTVRDAQEVKCFRLCLKAPCRGIDFW